MKYLSLITLCFFLLTGCVNSQTQQKSVIENVDAAKFKQLVDAKRGIVLDVRTPGEVADGYIGGATHIDISDSNFESRINQLDKNKDIYVYCAAGGRSSSAAEILQKNGFVRVYNLEEGFDGWKSKNFPVAKP